MRIRRMSIRCSYLIALGLAPLLARGQSSLIVQAGSVVGGAANVCVTIVDAKTTINGDLNGIESFTVAGSLGADDVAIGGTGNATFEKLIIDKDAGDGKLEMSVVVTDSLIIRGGNLNIVSYEVDLQDTGVVFEEAASHIYGTTGTIVVRNRTINQGATSNIGNLGLTVTPNSSSLFISSLTRGTESQTGAGKQGIKRFYDIIGTPNLGLNATVRMDYFTEDYDSIHGGTDESTFQFWTSADAGSTWVNEFGTSDPSANFVSATGLDSLNRITISSSSTNALPVEYLAFYAVVEDGPSVNLHWRTGHEVDNSGFIVERSGDLNKWDELGLVEGAGTSTTENRYSFTDIDPLLGLGYYRLKQVDASGSANYSEVLSVRVEMGNLILAYPTLAVNEVFLKLDDLVGEELESVHLVDLAGVRQAIPVQAMNPPGLFRLDVSQALTGNYMIAIDFKGQLVTKRIIKVAQ